MKILIADDHAATRLGVIAFLKSQGNYIIVGEAENGREAVGLCEKLQPDVVLLDVVMPVLNGIDAARQIAKCSPRSQIIFLSMHPDRKFINQAMEAGGRGYVMKDGKLAEIGLAVKAVLEDRIYISPALEAKTDSPSRASRLTPRERQVLQLIAEGHSTKEIALQLDLGAKTIETHRRQIMEKLGIHSVAALTHYAIKEGLTKLA